AISAGIALSTLGFLSQSILTAPRVYFAMAEDGLFFRTVARVSRRTRVPAVAIGLQGAVTVALALLGTYEAILRYVVAIDFVFFALTAGCLFVFRRTSGLCRRPAEAEGRSIGARRAHAMPGHPVTTLAFIAMEVAGYKVAAAEINEKGGVLGRPIELVIEDDASNQNAALAAAEKLAGQNVPLILGAFASSITKPLAGYLGRIKVPLVNTNSAD